MKIRWDLDGEKLFEIGTDRGVVYPFDADTKEYTTGYAWNGLTGVDESPSGSENNPIYANNAEYAKNRSAEEFSATINAYTYPEEFELLDGTASFADGAVRAKQQKRKRFAFTYRTRIGNDLVGDEYGYKIHLLYNCIAAPSSKSMETVNNDPNATTFSWELSTTPIEIDGFKRSAHIVIDSRLAFPASMAILEDMLYGTEDTDPRMPTIDELRDLYPRITLSGSIVAFDNGAPDQPVVDLTNAFEPIQDLNGYDYPWAGGAGKNLIPYPYYSDDGTYGGVSFSTDAQGKVTASGSAGAVNFYLEREQLYSLPAGTYTASIYGTFSGCFFIVRDNAESINYVKVTATGSYTFTLESDTALRVYINHPKDVSDISIDAYFQIESGSTATDYEPYSNICPISGHDSATVHRTGKNLATTFNNAGTINGVTWEVNNDGSVHVYGTPTGNVTRYATSNFVLPAGEYVLSGAPYGSSNGTMDIILSNMVTSTVIARSYDGTADDHFTLTELTPVRYGIRCHLGASETRYDGIFYPMIRLASDTDATYEPYQGDTYTVQFGDTIYGGALDFTTGVLTATYLSIAFDGTESWAGSNIGADNRFFRYVINDNTVSNDHRDLRKCSHFPNVQIYSDNVLEGYFAYTSVTSAPSKIWMNFRPPISIASTVDEWKAYLASQYAAGTPVTAVTYIENPVVIQLTPQEITTLLGHNTIWGDSGEVEVTYRATEFPD